MNRVAGVSAAIFFFLSLPGLGLGRNSVDGPPLRSTRLAETDLEVGGELAGLPASTTRFVSYKDLLALPQVTYTVSDDTNFAGKTQISGIPLTSLIQLLGAAPNARLVEAICYDGYQANYPAAYLGAHHPLLVLRINGKNEEKWPESQRHRLGPYLISNPTYTPSFRVLSHTDERQIPFGVTRIEFRQEQAVLGSIAPPGNHAPDSPVVNGYRIAQQNCFRCHNMGAEGGRLSGRNWQVLAVWAATEPRYFSSYVKNPQAIDPKDHMPGNPQYDPATIDALRQYFATFATAGKPGGSQ
jgi:mono/diheme cytochrome c family protein